MNRYTNIILTVIAVLLALHLVMPLISPKNADAYGTGQQVMVTNYETDQAPGETLYVFCKNC